MVATITPAHPPVLALQVLCFSWFPRGKWNSSGDLNSMCFKRKKLFPLQIKTVILFTKRQLKWENLHRKYTWSSILKKFTAEKKGFTFEQYECWYQSLWHHCAFPVHADLHNSVPIQLLLIGNSSFIPYHCNIYWSSSLLDATIAFSPTLKFTYLIKI